MISEAEFAVSLIIFRDTKNILHYYIKHRILRKLQSIDNKKLNVIDI